MRRLGVIAIVIVGLWSLVQAVALLSMPVEILVFGGGSHSKALSFGVLLIPAVGAVVLSVLVILNRRRLSERWFDDVPVDLSLSVVPLLRVGVALIGLGLIAYALPAFLGSITRPFLLSGPPSAYGLGYVWRTSVPAIVVEVAEAVIGVLLIAFSGTIAGRLWSGRPVKQIPAEPTELSRCPSCGAAYDPADYRGGHFTARCSVCGARLDVKDT